MLRMRYLKMHENHVVIIPRELHAALDLCVLIKKRKQKYYDKFAEDQKETHRGD